ncbi:MAG: DUF3368 domain-containing protein [Chloroflexota bacterium]|nr:DUF3368 domain-containing protein [Chloroflexota bacterium]MBI5702787.1 DUF3368 domain-containing protein [Chloroflexota bacterium]
MSDRWVLNASPLIVMGKIGQIDLFTAIAQKVVLPAAVAEEIKAGPENDAARLAIEAGKFPIVEAPPASPELMAWDLGAGETSVISFALSNPDWTAILDDAAARKCATSFGVPVKGSLAVIVLAKRRGLIPSAKQLLRALQAAGLHLDEKLISQILMTVREE